MAYSIIIIDDSQDYRSLLELYILRGCDECQVESYDPVSRGKPGADFAWSKYDVALLDYDLGEENGLDWLADFNSLPGFPPVIFMTGEGSERIAARAIKFGAEDYLPKSEISGKTLLSAISSAARAWDAKPSAIDEKKQFLEVLESARESAGKCQPALFFMEIDQWSAILASEGPHLLARVISDATDIIRGVAKKMAIDCYIFNFSDHEMAFVLPDGADGEHCRAIGKKICEDMTASQFEYTNQTLSCTCSVGVTSITVQDNGVRDIIKKADAACRAARIQGGNRFCYFPSSRQASQTRAPGDQPVKASKTPPAKAPATPPPAKSLLEDLSEAAEKFFALSGQDPADAMIADLLRAGRECVEYIAYEKIDDEQGDTVAEQLFRISPFCTDYAGEKIGGPGLTSAARAHGLDVELDRMVSKFAIKQAFHYRKQSNQQVVMVCSLVSAYLRRPVFFQQLLSLFDKLPKGDAGKVLVFRMSVVDYISQPKEYIESLRMLRQKTGVRFCITGIRDDASLKLCRHSKIFDFVELSVSMLSNADDMVRNRVAEILNGISIKLIITGIDTPEQLMHMLMFAPDYIQGDFIAGPTKEIKLADSAVTHITM